MFATLIGPYPDIDGSPRDRLVATIGDQLDAGLGMLSDGQVHVVAARGAGPAWSMRGWPRMRSGGSSLRKRVSSRRSSRPASLARGRRAVGSPTGVRAAVDAIWPAIEALFGAGAPVVQVTEPAIGDIGADDVEAIDLLDEVLERLATGVEGHLSLALAGGRPTAIPYERLFAAPFGSYLFDLIRSPDDWRLCARVPPDVRPHRGRGRCPDGQAGCIVGHHMGCPVRRLAGRPRPRTRGSVPICWPGPAASGRRAREVGRSSPRPSGRRNCRERISRGRSIRWM